MKVKISITLSEDVVNRLGRAARRGENRSETIERLLRERLQVEARNATDSGDRALIDKHAVELNTEAEDVLTYQAGVPSRRIVPSRTL